LMVNVYSCLKTRCDNYEGTVELYGGF
jgi:hypothetical protein